MRVLEGFCRFVVGLDVEDSLFSRQRCSGGFVYWICPYTEQRFKAIAILARHLQCRYSKDLRENIYRLEWSFKWFAKRELKLW